MRLSERETRCLRAWDGISRDYCLNFKGVTRRSDVEPHNVRRVVRALARKGMLEFQRGLFNETDGSLAGAGYGLTSAGESHLAELARADPQ